MHVGTITKNCLRRVERKFVGKTENWLAFWKKFWLLPCDCVYLYIMCLLIKIWPDFNTVWLTTVHEKDVLIYNRISRNTVGT
jgi:hypothetical protein